MAEAQSLANTAWWELFDDPQLQELIRIALVENKDLKIAVERIEEARARYGFTKADLWPKFDLTGYRGPPPLQPGQPHPHARGGPGHRERGHGDRDLLPLRRRVLGARFPRAHPPGHGGPERALPRHAGGAPRRGADAGRGRGRGLLRAARFRPPARGGAAHDRVAPRVRAVREGPLRRRRHPRDGLPPGRGRAAPRRDRGVRPGAPHRPEGERAVRAPRPQSRARSCAAAPSRSRSCPPRSPPAFPPSCSTAAPTSARPSRRWPPRPPTSARPRRCSFRGSRSPAPTASPAPSSTRCSRAPASPGTSSATCCSRSSTPARTSAASR